MLFRSICRLMHRPPDILSLAYRQSILQDQFVLLQEKERQIPGSVQYSIKRYHQAGNWNMDDLGMLVYHYEKSNKKNNYLELKFCVSGNVYCRQKDIECDMCKYSASKTCVERVESVDVIDRKSVV